MRSRDESCQPKPRAHHLSRRRAAQWTLLAAATLLSACGQVQVELASGTADSDGVDATTDSAAADAADSAPSDSAQPEDAPDAADPDASAPDAPPPDTSLPQPRPRRLAPSAALVASSPPSSPSRRRRSW